MENSTIENTMTQATNFDAQEPILQDTQDRFVLFPIQHEEMWHMYKCAEASFWVAEEIDLADDMIDWDPLFRIMSASRCCQGHTRRYYW